MSLLNRIKSKCRSRLSIKLANWQMRIAANRPKFGEVDWLAILSIYLEVQQRPWQIRWCLEVGSDPCVLTCGERAAA